MQENSNPRKGTPYKKHLNSRKQLFSPSKLSPSFPLLSHHQPPATLFGGPTRRATVPCTSPRARAPFRRCVCCSRPRPSCSGGLPREPRRCSTEHKTDVWRTGTRGGEGRLDWVVGVCFCLFFDNLEGLSWALLCVLRVFVFYFEVFWGWWFFGSLLLPCRDLFWLVGQILVIYWVVLFGW